MAYYKRLPLYAKFFEGVSIEQNFVSSGMNIEIRIRCYELSLPDMKSQFGAHHITLGTPCFPNIS
jgi:hypothetical protein